MLVVCNFTRTRRCGRITIFQSRVRVPGPRLAQISLCDLINGIFCGTCTALFISSFYFYFFFLGDLSTLFSFLPLSLSTHAFPLDERRREGKNYRRYYHYTNKGTQTGAGTVFVLGNGRQIPGMGDKYKRLNGISIILAIISPSFRPLCPMLYLPYISNKCFPLL